MTWKSRFAGSVVDRLLRGEELALLCIEGMIIYPMTAVCILHREGAHGYNRQSN
ncbi:MAG: hypothetical protein AAGF95_25470 [Chloroflexota bacterium]